jgi:hypothetical protein
MSGETRLRSIPTVAEIELEPFVLTRELSDPLETFLVHCTVRWAASRPVECDHISGSERLRIVRERMRRNGRGCAPSRVPTWDAESVGSSDSEALHHNATSAPFTLCRIDVAECLALPPFQL